MVVMNSSVLIFSNHEMVEYYGTVVVCATLFHRIKDAGLNPADVSLFISMCDSNSQHGDKTI